MIRVPHQPFALSTDAKGDGQTNTQQSLTRESAACHCIEEVVRSHEEDQSDRIDDFLRRLNRRRFEVAQMGKTSESK
jgi:hypothetical protein